MKIKSIYPSGTADVYNMEVDETHSFLVESGFVVHNCYDSVRYGCMSRPIASTRKKPELTLIQKHKQKLASARVYNRSRIM